MTIKQFCDNISSHFLFGERPQPMQFAFGPFFGPQGLYFSFSLHFHILQTFDCQFPKQPQPGGEASLSLTMAKSKVT
jgi:hypothetical protein